MTRRYQAMFPPRPGMTWGDRIMVGIAVIFVVLSFFAIWAVMLLTTPAMATWKPEYANAPQAIQDWYKEAELTPAAQARLGWLKCCDHADVVRTQFKVDKSSGEDKWLWLDGDQWRVIPPDIIHYDRRAPGGKPILFVYAKKPTCFFLPESGI